MTQFLTNERKLLQQLHKSTPFSSSGSVDISNFRNYTKTMFKCCVGLFISRNTCRYGQPATQLVNLVMSDPN